MKPFEYFRPRELDDVFALKHQHGSEALLLAGGTDVIVKLRAGLGPKIVIDLKRVSALRDGIKESDGLLRIGARTVMADIIKHVGVRRHFPALVEGAKVVGSVQIRNRATLAGNICNASPAADTVPALLVYGARLNLIGHRGTRTVPLADFFTGPGKTILGNGELLESIELPIPARPTGAAFARITRRRGVDLATINLCCLVDSEGLTRFAFGAVGPKPVLVEDRSGVLAGYSKGRTAKEDVLAEMISRTSPISNVRGSREYRLAMLSTMSERALASAIENLRGTQTN
jgi:CO/xanthine dehydrogenase FAD-binding subunit